jgi:hypothetical protein
LGEVAAYLDEMDVPKPIIDSMVATSSGDILWVNDFDDRLEKPPSVAEWVDASCGSDANLYTDELTGEVVLKSFKHAVCARNLYASNRGRLAPP